MPGTTLAELLERNARHVRSVSSEHFSEVRTHQEPLAVSICCADSRVSQEGMWNIDKPGWLFTPSTIGNQVWDRYDGERIVDGSVLYPMAYTDTEVTIVVGHTGCGAITAALEVVEGDRLEAPPGVRKWIEMLTPVIEDGLADPRVDRQRNVSLVDQLVEYNVDRQVAFLRSSEDVPADETIYGFVYDFQRVYGDVDGKVYLVNAEGESDPVSLRERVPDSFEDHVHRLLSVA